MENRIKVLAVLIASLLFTFVACQKEESISQNGVTDLKTDEALIEFDAQNQGQNMLPRFFEKTILEDIVKSEDCEYPLSGIIDFSLNEVTVLTINFGDGECDNIATQTVNGEDLEFELPEHPEMPTHPQGQGNHQNGNGNGQGNHPNGNGQGMHQHNGNGNGQGMHPQRPHHPHFITRTVVEEIVKSEDCEYPVSGIIEFYANDVLIATVDFGNGECDNIATQTINGESLEFELPEPPTAPVQNEGQARFKKVIVEPLVQGDCDYIVSGSIKYFKEEEWIATVDFGDGTCDDIATKTTNKGTFEFTLKNKKW